MDKSRVESTIFFIEKISFSMKLFSGHFYGQSFIKTVRGPLSSAFFKINFFQKKSVINTISVKQFGSRSGPTDNILNCLQRFSADDKSPLAKKEFRGKPFSKTFSIFYVLNSKNRVFNPYFSIGTCPIRKRLLWISRGLNLLSFS